MAPEDVLVTKLMALTEHSLRFAGAFFAMLEGLGIVTGAKPTTGGHSPRVRVLTPQGSAAGDAG